MAGTYSKEWRVTREDGTVATRSNTWSPRDRIPLDMALRLSPMAAVSSASRATTNNPITQGRVNALNLALREYTYSPIASSIP